MLISCAGPFNLMAEDIGGPMVRAAAVVMELLVAFGIRELRREKARKEQHKQPHKEEVASAVPQQSVLCQSERVCTPHELCAYSFGPCSSPCFTRSRRR